MFSQETNKRAGERGREWERIKTSTWKIIKRQMTKATVIGLDNKTLDRKRKNHISFHFVDINVCHYDDYCHHFDPWMRSPSDESATGWRVSFDGSHSCLSKPSRKRNNKHIRGRFQEHHHWIRNRSFRLQIAISVRYSGGGNERKFFFLSEKWLKLNAQIRIMNI